jgi:hypothetical protein
MRKLAAPKTSLRSAAVIATLRTADLSCAASATGGGVAVPNEFPAAAEAPYPR